MAKPLRPDELREITDPVLPPPPTPAPKVGRPSVGNRETLTGILFVLKTGVPGRTCPARWAANRA